MSHGRSTQWLHRSLILLAFACLAFAAPIMPDDVIRMAKEGQSDSAIIAAIYDSGATFDLTADGVAELHDQGVSDPVIDAMIETSPPPGEEAEPAEENAPPPVAVAYPV